MQYIFFGSHIDSQVQVSISTKICDNDLIVRPNRIIIFICIYYIPFLLVTNVIPVSFIIIKE